MYIKRIKRIYTRVEFANIVVYVYLFTFWSLLSAKPCIYWLSACFLLLIG